MPPTHLCHVGAGIAVLAAALHVGIVRRSNDLPTSGYHARGDA